MGAMEWLNTFAFAGRPPSVIYDRLAGKER